MPTELPAVHLTGVQAVVLDLDDTLYPEQAYAFSGFAAVGAWLRGRVACAFDPAERMRALFLAGERGHIFDCLLAELAVPDAPALLPEMIQCYRTHRPAIAFHPDARLALDRWRGRFRMGLISDGPLAMQQAKVDALGLSAMLDEIVLTGQWGAEYSKPHPRAFEHLEAKFSIRGPALVYVADNCAKDFVAPRQLGWQTIWVHRPGSVYYDAKPPPNGKPEHQVESLSQLDLLC